MATPIGHALAGYAVSRWHAEKPISFALFKQPFPDLLRTLVQPIFWTVYCVFMAAAPDLDLIPGILQGQPILYHSGISHSFGFGIGISLLAAFVLQRFGWSFKRTFLVGLFAYSTHLLLDPLGPDGREPYGIPLLWPLTSQTFLSPIPILPGVHHANSSSASIAKVISGVLSLHNLMAIGIELLLVGPFCFLRPFTKWTWTRVWTRDTSESNL